MKENDIKIGNSLLLYGEVVKVTEIGFRNNDYYLRVEGNKNGYYLDQFEPIEITEDILLKCRFEQSAWDNYSTFRNLFCSDGCIVMSLEHKYIEIGDLTLDIEIKHLHQLQNLYYCLVGTELKIEL